MRKGDTLYGVNQSGMIGEGVVKGILHRTNINGYYFDSDVPQPCHELYTGPKDRSKSDSIFDYRLFNITHVFTSHEEANKCYFLQVLSGNKNIKGVS